MKLSWNHKNVDEFVMELHWKQRIKKRPEFHSENLTIYKYIHVYMSTFKLIIFHWHFVILVLNYWNKKISENDIILFEISKIIKDLKIKIHDWILKDGHFYHYFNSSVS